MLDLDQYQKACHVRLTQIFRKKPDAVVALMRREDGETYVSRIYDHAVRGYEVARKLTIPELPRVFVLRQNIYVPAKRTQAVFDMCGHLGCSGDRTRHFFAAQPGKGKE